MDRSPAVQPSVIESSPMPALEGVVSTRAEGVPSAREARAARDAERDASGILPPPPLARGQLLLRTLGVAEVHVGGVGVVSPAAERMFSLLVLGAMTPDHAMARDDVLALVWPDTDRESARHSLRQHLYKLRGWGVPIQATRATVTLSRACLVPCFALDRTAALFDRDVLRGGEPFGHLFAGWTPTIPAMRRWVEDQRDRFQMDVRRILIPELRRLRDRADWLECERWARTVLEFDPYNEDGMLVLAEAIAMQGSRHSAHTMLDGYVRETGLAGTDLAQDLEAAQRRIGRATRVRHEAAATPTLVGRDAEVRQLDAITLAALQGQTQVVHITGPAGIGKTELAYEATRRAVILGFTRCIVRVTRAMGQMPLGMLSRLVRDLLRLPGALGCRPESIAALRAVASLDDALDGSAEPPHHTTNLAECISELIRSVAEESPLAILVDAPLNADSHSLELLATSTELVGNAQVLLLLTPRHDGASSGATRRIPQHTARVALGPLTASACVELASNVVTSTGRRLSVQDAEAAVVGSDRTPLQVISLARDALTQGIVAPGPNRARDAVLRQVRSLPQSARHLLDVLALLGGELKLDLLDSIVDLSLHDRVDACRGLLDEGLAESPSPSMIRLHDSVREVAFSALTATDRQLISGQTILRLERSLAESFDSEAALVLFSLLRESPQVEQSSRTCLLLAIPLARAGYAKPASEALERLSRATTDRTLQTTLLEQQLEVARIAADWRSAITASSYLQGTDRRLQPEAELIALEAALRADLLYDGPRNAGRALELARDSQLPLQLRLRAARLVISSASDLLDRPLAHAAYNEMIAIRGLSQDSQQEHRELLMQYHAIFGDQTESVDIARRCIDDLKDLPLTPDHARVISNAAYALRLAGDTKLAYTTLRRVAESTELRGAPARRGFAAWQLSLIAADRDDSISAHVWASHLTELARNELDCDQELWFTNHQLRMELLSKRRIEGGEHLIARIQLERGQASRSLLYCTALALRARAARDDESFRRELLDEAVHYLEEFGSLAGMDLLFSSACESLAELQEEGRAVELINRYLGSDRRECGQPIYALNRLSGALRDHAIAALARRR